MNELSQMFPALDGELSSVAHFRFDHLVAPAEESSQMVDPNELKTPLQSVKQFPNTSNEQALDEEDDDATISTDCLTTQSDSKSTQHQIVSTATQLLEDIINNSSPRHPPETIAETMKRNSNLQIHKQFSLHGSESTSLIGAITQTSNMTSDSVGRFPRRNIEYSRFLSVDQRSISDVEDNVTIESGSMNNKDNKTQSCANISCIAPRSPRSPGAIVVKEKYIELPKQVAHMAKSPSKDHCEPVDSSRNSTSLTSSTESVSRLAKSERTKQRFTTTKVDESQLGVSVLKEV